MEAGFISILLSLMGLCWGSFLNVLIVRSLSGESIILPASKCPKCNTPLLWWHNIPILSYFLLKGRCGFCNSTISIQYPIIELLGAVIFVFSFLKYISIFDAISVVLIVSMFLVMSITDVKELKISKSQSFIIILAALIFNRYNIFNALLGGFVGASVIVLLTELGLRLFNKKTFGIGDIYLLGALGAVVGLDRLFVFIIYALFIQVLLILPSYIMSLWRSEQIEKLKYLILFISACLFLYVLRNISCFILNLLLPVLLGVILFSAYKLIKSLYYLLKVQENESYCPLAPAVAISCVLFLL